ncbi:uncharacterized protein Tco_1043834 [Tanacetum coccineum]|uniref:Uncharacterized protein n=1 Tax=Tanacetum coccineum TaxID=301880 RepID=A0ABQ5GNR0_9ASTR
MRRTPFTLCGEGSVRFLQGPIEAIGQYGPGLKPPSYHELRVPLLQKEIDYTNGLLQNHKEEWKKHGCSIMSDACYASSYMHTADKLFDLLDDFIEEIREANVVQVVTDNGANYVAAGKLLEVKRPNLYWTPCAAHCIDLMLEDIGKIPKVDLVRAGKTRFATCYLNLKRIKELKDKLRSMFISEEWQSSKWSKETKGKKIAETVLDTHFWNNVSYILTAMGALVKVLRHVDGEQKPSMGYIYEAMNRAKKAIEEGFKFNSSKYQRINQIIDNRWESQLHRPLHVAGHLLNPEYFYDKPELEFNTEITTSLEVSRKEKSPAEWWTLFGSSAPNLQRFAIKVLSLTCSSCGCERNWSVFQQIHTKRRNRLEQKKLNDLVFVKYNQKLKARYDNRKTIDPICLDDVDESNEWLTGSNDAEGEFVFGEDEALTWGTVACASGVNEPMHYTRRNASASTSRTSTSRRLYDESD